MLDSIKDMERTGLWTEIRRLVPANLSGVAGEEKARFHLSLSTAYYFTAETGADWRQALAHARQALACAKPNGLLYGWALQKISSLSVDMGRPQEARPYGLAYLKLASHHAKLQCLTPLVVRDLSHVAYQQRRWGEAIRLRLQALSLFRQLPDQSQVVRTQLNLAWAYARADKPRMARACMPPNVAADMQPLLDGAWAVIHAAERNWRGAIAAARRALVGVRASCDWADAAEVCLILSQSLKALDAAADASVSIKEAISLAARQDRSAYTLLVLSLRQKGGDTPDETASRGSGGWHPDARYTTGVA